jgi:hypothetical protein
MDEVVEAPAVEELPKETPKPEAEVRAQDAEPELPLEAEAIVAEEPAPEPEVTPAEQDWRDKEIKRKHAQVQEGKRREAEKDQRIADLEAIATGVTDPQTAAPVSRQPSQDAIQRAAQQMRAQERFQENLVNTNAAGEKAYGADWTAAIDQLATLGEVGADTLSGIMATDDPAKVLYSLGKNPNEYHRIMDIQDPLRRQTEFAKLSLKPVAAKPSNAPAPTEPVKTRTTPVVEMSDKMTDEQWYAERQKARQAKFKQRA